MVDAPDPQSGQHEHLYLPYDVAQARSKAQTGTKHRPVIGTCQLCGEPIDLMPSMLKALEKQGYVEKPKPPPPRRNGPIDPRTMLP